MLTCNLVQGTIHTKDNLGLYKTLFELQSQMDAAARAYDSERAHNHLLQAEIALLQEQLAEIHQELQNMEERCYLEEKAALALPAIPPAGYVITTSRMATSLD